MGCGSSLKNKQVVATAPLCHLPLVIEHSSECTVLQPDARLSCGSACMRNSSSMSSLNRRVSQNGDGGSYSNIFFESEMGMAGSCSVDLASKPCMKTLHRTVFKDIKCAKDVFIDCGKSICLLGTSLPHRGEAHQSLPVENGSTAVIEPENNEKVIALCGAENEEKLAQLLARDGIAYSCRKGKKPESPNQDSILLSSDGNITCIGVADGHGADGHWVSHWTVHYALHLALKEISALGHLPEEVGLFKIFNITQEALKLRAAESKFDLEESGSTLTLCFVDHTEQTVIVAWVGDSRCVVSRKEGVEAESLSIDHKPNDMEERKRIMVHGGSVVQQNGTARVCANRGGTGAMLAVARAIGDLSLSGFGVTHRPGMTGSRFGDLMDEFILCCSDGVWEFMSHDEVTAIIRKAGRGHVDEGVNELVEEARRRWLKIENDKMTDDISAIVVWL